MPANIEILENFKDVFVDKKAAPLLPHLGERGRGKIDSGQNYWYDSCRISLNMEICSTFEYIVINTKYQFFRYTTMMNQEDIFKKIGQILNELKDQYQYLAENPDDLNELELELFLANASFLTDHVQIVRKLNSKKFQKILPEHAASAGETIKREPVILSTTVIDKPVVPEQSEALPRANETLNLPAEETAHSKPSIEEDIFKPDYEPSTFEFILSDKPSLDKFEFEEKPIGEIFDRPLSEEEEHIIAQKQKLRELDSLESQLPEEDEIGPEPFLVSEPELEIPETAIPDPEPVEDPETTEEPAPVEEPEPHEEVKAVIETEPEPEEEVEAITEEKTVTAEKTVIEEEPEPEEELTAVIEEAKAEPEVEAKETFIPYQSESVAYVAPLTETPVRPEPKPVTADKYRTEDSPKGKPTLNDILSGNTAARNPISTSGRMPVTDLKQAISLNDKMRYIKDLFNGYNLAYAEVIDLINKMPDFKTADSFLQHNYAGKNNWAAKQETVDQFYELLHQRFPAK